MKYRSPETLLREEMRQLQQAREEARHGNASEEMAGKL